MLVPKLGVGFSTIFLNYKMLPPYHRPCFELLFLCRLEWDEKATLLHNYKSLGILANPNVLGARSGTRNVVQLVSLQKPMSDDGTEVFGSDDENDGKLAGLLVAM